VVAWHELDASEPEFTARVRAVLDAHKHKVLATLRRDGSPRLSGQEVELTGGHLVLGMMEGSIRAADLRRDPRVALHTCSDDPPPDPHAWAGDVKLSGTASEPTPYRFVVDVTEVVLTKVGDPPDHLLIESWHPGRGVEVLRRA
jgi:hypothetical protein